MRKQLSALLATDFVQAFALNSTANQARLGDAATFEKIVKGNASFRVLLDSATQVDVAADATSETTAAIRVAAQPEHPNAPATFVFDLSCEEASGQWQTDGVRIEC